MSRSDIAVQASGLGKRYRRLWALRDCSFELPVGRIAALVGANGAGKTTLLAIMAGLLAPTTGQASVHGTRRVTFVAQEKPLYRDFTVADMLRFGARTNLVWDQRRAERWLGRFGVPLDRRCRKMSGGQRQGAGRHQRPDDRLVAGACRVRHGRVVRAGPSLLQRGWNRR